MSQLLFACSCVHCTKNCHWKACEWLARNTSKHTCLLVLNDASILGSALNITSFGWKTLCSTETQPSSQSRQNFWLPFQRALVRAMLVRTVFNSLSFKDCCNCSLTVISADGIVPLHQACGCHNGTSCVMWWCVSLLIYPSLVAQVWERLHGKWRSQVQFRG